MRPVWLSTVRRTRAVEQDPPSVLAERVLAAAFDGPTGCLTYAAIRGELRREIGRCVGHGGTMSCGLIEFDGFKRINARFGHAHGSRILAAVARMLQDGVRTGDRVGRYGGDQFVVLLPDTDQAAAHALGERLRSMISTVTLSDTASVSTRRSVWRNGDPAGPLTSCLRPLIARCWKRSRSEKDSLSQPEPSQPWQVLRSPSEGAAEAWLTHTTRTIRHKSALPPRCRTEPSTRNGGSRLSRRRSRSAFGCPGVGDAKECGLRQASQFRPERNVRSLRSIGGAG